MIYVYIVLRLLERGLVVGLVNQMLLSPSLLRASAECLSETPNQSKNNSSSLFPFLIFNMVDNC